ncbi:hypothetical protein GPALN_014981 [Globodera pallida]|nr:hypothetical protein GPALN_014981 [Globodera pallida]
MKSATRSGEMRQQRLFLPRELIYELLPFVPGGTVWWARRPLIASALLYRFIVGGKNAKNWRQAYDIRVRENEFFERQMGPHNTFCFLPRTHNVNLPVNMENLSLANLFQYAHQSGDRLIWTVVLITDDRKFRSVAHQKKARAYISKAKQVSGTWLTTVGCGLDAFKLISYPEEVRLD